MHEHQERILELLAHHDAVRFSELERFFDLPSNKLSYHLNRLQDEGLVEKNDTKYRLTDRGTIVTPYLGRDSQPLPVVLVAPVRDGKTLLVKRKKEVYRGYYAIPSTTVAYGETPEETVDRLKERYGLELEDTEYCKTVVEIDETEDGQHHFIFLVYQTRPCNQPDGMTFFDIDTLEQQDDVIPTDARIITNLDEDGIDVVGMDVRNGLELWDEGNTPDSP